MFEVRGFGMRIQQLAVLNPYAHFAIPDQTGMTGGTLSLKNSQRVIMKQVFAISGIFSICKKILIKQTLNNFAVGMTYNIISRERSMF